MPPAALRDQTWRQRYGDTQQGFDFTYVPSADGFTTTSLQTIGSLLGLSQGDLIDQNYALSSAGGCSADTTDGGAGCAIAELEFVLPVDSDDATNARNHRDFNNEIDLQLGFDNSNISGVEGGDGFAEVTGDPENVRTGLEFSIPLDELGLSATGFVGDIKITAYINGTGHDFVSNQFSGDGVSTTNIGSFPPDLSSQAEGDQFVTVSVTALELKSVPEPTSLLLLGLSAACGLLLRRRSQGTRATAATRFTPQKNDCGGGSLTAPRSIRARATYGSSAFAAMAVGSSIRNFAPEKVPGAKLSVPS